METINEKKLTVNTIEVPSKGWSGTTGETEFFKMSVAKDIKANEWIYHSFFDKRTGFTVRYGRILEEDATLSPFGNTIADIEVVSGKCPKINGKNCKFCYKSNGGDMAKCMTCEQAEKLLDFINQNNQLEQVAYGITGFYTNPEFIKILEMTRRKGIIPNYTTNGVDIDEAAIEATLQNCGRVAVSCYEDANDICYNTIKRFGDVAKMMGKSFPCNIHVVLSKGTYSHVMKVLEDAKDGKIENLGAVVILRIKNVGRAKHLDAKIPEEMYENIIKYCLKHRIKFGFDSCGCHIVEEVLKKINRNDLVSLVEPCEGGMFSAYYNVDSKYYHCSFCEQLEEHFPIDPYKYKTYTDFWHSEELERLRKPRDKWKCKSCPYLELDNNRSIC